MLRLRVPSEPPGSWLRLDYRFLESDQIVLIFDVKTKTFISKPLSNYKSLPPLETMETIDTV